MKGHRSRSKGSRLELGERTFIISLAMRPPSLVADGSVTERERWSHMPCPMLPLRMCSGAPSIARQIFIVSCVPDTPEA